MSAWFLDSELSTCFNGLYCNFINVPLGTVFANPVTYVATT